MSLQKFPDVARHTPFEHVSPISQSSLPFWTLHVPFKPALVLHFPAKHESMVRSHSMSEKQSPPVGDWQFSPSPSFFFFCQHTKKKRKEKKKEKKRKEKKGHKPTHLEPAILQSFSVLQIPPGPTFPRAGPQVPSAVQAVPPTQCSGFWQTPPETERGLHSSLMHTLRRH